MKIGILTLPLHTNYGGLLQAYALQNVLKRMGHEVWIIDRRSNESLRSNLYSFLKRLILFVLGRISTIKQIRPSIDEYNLIAKHTNRFIQENINQTVTIDSSKKFLLLKSYEFEAYIVGSDQVWRPEYSPCITNYFLDFLSKNDKVKKIAYAASFGVEEWRLSPNSKNKCAKLAKKFNAISVREKSAVEVCDKFLGIKSEYLLDPTMLLNKEDYIKLFEKDCISKSEGNLMTYILDKSKEKTEIIQKIASNLDLIPFSVMPKNEYSQIRKSEIENCIFPPVTKWLRGFYDADFIVTDSFHGTVFSIIFNKPFISIVNKERGVDRFISLLNIFGLQDRLIYSLDELTSEKILKTIDYEKIKGKLNFEQQRGEKYIIKALEK